MTDKLIVYPHASGEDYLEAIYILSRKQNHVRSVDVSEFLNLSKPSVSRAVGILKNGGFLTMDDNKFLFLTELGSELAAQIYEKHQFFTRLLISFGVDEQIAAKDACKIEHVISKNSFECIRNAYMLK